MTIDNRELLFYYDRVFPFAKLEKWLCQGTPDVLGKREFSMSLDKDGQEVYLRWLCCRGVNQLKDRILSSQLVPHKFDIGAIYSFNVSEKEARRKQFFPMEKELVFDIDMNDYDAVRTCCQDKVVCSKCWRFMVIAIECLETALRDDFGFEKILWVFSGRRGVHCWVCDPEARQLNTKARIAVAEYLSIIKGSDPATCVWLNRKGRLHPMIRRAYGICNSYFVELMREQDLFKRGSPHVEKLIARLPANKKAGFDNKTAMWDGSSDEFWKMYTSVLMGKDEGRLIESTVLGFTYPRLDINVSKDTGHLLKSPFCVHHSTGKICVPIPPRYLKTFDPDNAPTLTEAVRFDGGRPAERISEYLRYFDEFVEELCREGENSSISW